MLWLLLACAPDDQLSGDGTDVTYTDPRTDHPQVDDDSWKVQRLRWVRGYDKETWELAQQGLLWSLAELGAVTSPVSHPIHVVSESEDEVVFDLDLLECGLPPNALEAVRIATEDTLTSDEKAIWGSVDLGRWIMRIVYEPWVYYAATGTCRNLDGWVAERLDPESVTYGVTVSNLVKDKNRLIALNDLPGSVERLAYLVTEGNGSIADGTFEPTEHEIVDVLPNGIHHYAVYDTDGSLLPGGSPEISAAGQPGSCMWCHESLWSQRGSSDNVSPPPGISYDDFQIQVDQVDRVADARRREMNTILDITEGDVHTWGEWLVEMFLHASPERLAREWHTTPADAQRILDELQIITVPSGEYPDLGDIAARDALDANAQQIVDDLAAIPDHPFAGKSLSYEPIRTQPESRAYDPAQVLFESDELDSLLMECASAP
jgi:hypothetical protein